MEKEKIKHFTDLIAWKKGHELSLLIYRLTENFSDNEKFGLISQMRRSSISITSNIAEGFGRRGFPDKMRFYDIAVGSLYELQSQLYICRDLGFLSQEQFNDSIEISKDTLRLLVAWMRILH